MRMYKEGDEERILELWKAVYPAAYPAAYPAVYSQREYDREKWLKWWQWMYKDNPAGPGRIWLAEHGSKIVGQYPLIFMNLKIGEEIVKASQNIDLMTHPDYQHQGIFSTLERTALDRTKEDGVHITIGFPNDAAYPGHIKSGWFDVAPMQVMFRPFNWRNSIRPRVKNKFLQAILATGAGLLFNKVFFRTQKPPSLEGLTINQVASFDNRVDDLWAKVSSQYHIMIVRDKDYLNWRYSAPGANYSIFVAEKAGEICGYLVLEHRLQSGTKLSFVFDLIAQSEELMHCLVSQAVDDCKQKKVDLILYLLIANKTYRRILKKSGFLSLPFLKGLRLCAYVSPQGTTLRESLKNPQNWLDQLGDSDAV